MNAKRADSTRTKAARTPIAMATIGLAAALLVTAIVGGGYWGWTRYQEIEHQQDVIARAKLRAEATERAKREAERIAAVKRKKEAAAEAKRRAASEAIRQTEEARRKAADAATAKQQTATASVTAEGGRIDPSKIKTPPMNSAETYIAYMTKWRGDDRTLLVKRWGRFRAMVKNRDLRREKEKRAFLLAPREEFARTRNPTRVYAHSWLGIGFGVTISGPHIVGRMTTEIDVKPGDKVLEIGTGSGYQSSILSYMTTKVYSIEIIPGLARVTDKIYTRLAKGKFKEYANVTRKAADGYFGWKKFAPFDKIIVTAGIDHVPPPLLRQLAVGGVMVIPVGPPGAQALLKITKVQSKSGKIRIRRHDIYASDPSRAGGRGKTKVSFVAFTKYNKAGKTISRWGKK
ncbi:MAG: protein-L-isoaspartate O-methyltransferase [Alphaproteobacteria bacterium]|nr:protein-L-isoaspartate O-methyltransferase [Alphaproteobacteria bacterium]